MKQFFEQYGGVALGILAVLVLIAMITPVGNIIKTSLQGVAEKFSTQIGAQTDTALEGAAYIQGSASEGPKYILSFNSNGGTTVSSQNVSRIPNSLQTPIKTGFTFDGWYTKADFSQSAVSNTKLTEDTTLYAKWNLVNYSITYNLDGGTLSGQKTSYTINDSAYALPTPTKDGSTFGGWYDNFAFTGSPITSISAGSTGNKELYAKWEAESNVLISGDFSTKGNLVTINGASYRVLESNGTQVKLLAMDSYKAGYFNNMTLDATYSGSLLDAEMTNYYNALPANVQSAIIEQNINQSAYSWDMSPSGNNALHITDNGDGEHYYTKKSTANVGNRKVFALGIQDIIDYLGSNITATQINEMFFNSSTSVNRSVWLRSANANDEKSAFLVRGAFGRAFSSGVAYSCDLRPAFVLDLSLLS